MIDTKIFSLILAGGSGSRLWPLSTKNRPKQFIRLFGQETLFQQTVSRSHPLIKSERTRVVCSLEYKDFIQSELKELGINPDGKLILEPAARNTGPALALAFQSIMNEEPEAIVVVLPSDHIIEPKSQFLSAIAVGISVAQKNKIVTLGIKPNGPETGFGYIQTTLPVILNSEQHVREFVEKPELERARQFLASGNYLWNSGIFISKARTVLDQLNLFHPEMVVAAEKALRGKIRSFHDLEPLSFDVAVMEKTDAARVIPVDFSWNDLGSWSSVYRQCELDSEGNAKYGQSIMLDSKNSLVLSKSRQVACIGVQDTIVVETPDSVLISRFDKTQRVSEALQCLQEFQNDEVQIGVTKLRPWGSFTIVDHRPGHKVKRLDIKPGKRISLQRHQHREEHWIVVSGSIVVTQESQIKILKKGETLLISKGQIHRIENQTKELASLYEVQLGEYLGEDDIERFDDDFCRQ